MMEVYQREPDFYFHYYWGKSRLCICSREYFYGTFHRTCVNICNTLVIKRPNRMQLVCTPVLITPLPPFCLTKNRIYAHFI